MSVTVLRGRSPDPERGDAHRDASRIKLAHSMGELCPDELAAYQAIRDAGEYISPSRLHSMYVRVMSSADADHDFGAHVLTYLNKQRRASIPVDSAVGERAVKRLLKGAHHHG